MLTERSGRMKRLAALCACALLAWPVARAAAESFQLKNGGRIEGELLNPKRSAHEPYRIRTPAGIQLSLTKDIVARVAVKREAELLYEQRLPKVPDTTAGHWAMAEWCKENGLRAQREHHLEEVLVRDPEHEAAHQALGHQRFNGKWQRPEEHMAAQGYVKYQGTWRTKQDAELAKLAAAREAKAIGWRQQIRMWRSWIGKKREAEAYANLRAIHDADAAPALIDLLTESNQPRDLRLLAVDVLAQLPGNPAEATLIDLAIHDADEGVRDACLDQLIRQESKAAVFQYIALLKSEKNAEVNQAATALGRLKDSLATPALIDALVTVHEIIVLPGSQSSGGLGPIASTFGNNASGGINPGGGAFSAGSAKPVKKKLAVNNDAVLVALTSIHPGVNFAFNEVVWKQWYIDLHQPPNVNLRRGE
jgi:hypothetical protein